MSKAKPAGVMSAVIKAEAAPGLTMVEKPVPSPRPDELLVRVQATSICGTDLHIYNWDNWAQTNIKPPVTLGHEFCGEVVGVGSEVRDFQVGDYVAAESHIYCGKCSMCRSGNRHICEEERIIGLDVDGAFADFAVFPARCAWRTDRSIPPEIATLQEPLGNSVHVTMIGEIKGKNVLVLGCGPTGLFATAIARLRGAQQVIAVDVNPLRLDLATRMGAHVTLDPSKGSIVSEVLERTGGAGADVVLEMSGNPRGIEDGLRSLRRAGDFRFFGVPSDRVSIDIARDVIFKAAQIRGVVGRRIFETWHDTKRLLEEGLDLRPIVTHKLPLRDFDRAFQLIREGNCGKVVLFPGAA